MKKRRLFSLLLAAAMSLALVSCGNGGDTSGNGTADGGNASQVDADGDGYKDREASHFYGSQPGPVADRYGL